MGRTKKQIVDPYFVLSLYDGGYKNGGPLKVVDTISNFNDQMSSDIVLAAYGKMLEKKYAYGGAGGEDPNAMPAMDWDSYLNAKDEDLLTEFAKDPNNPHGENKVDVPSLLPGIAGMGASAIQNFSTDKQEDRTTNKEIAQDSISSALTLGGQGASIGANPALMAATGGLSLPIGAALGIAAGATKGIIEGKKQQEDQAAALKDLYYGALGGKLPKTEKRQEAGFTIRQDQYGDQNYFDYSKEGLLSLGINPDDYQMDGQTQKVGLFDSIQRAMQINKNTRESGRDVSRVKLNAFVDRTVNEIPTFAFGGDILDPTNPKVTGDNSSAFTDMNINTLQENPYLYEYLKNNASKFAFGGEITDLNGPSHENGGIQLTQNAEVEGGEVKVDDYIFSDRLILEGTNKTFADEAKKIKKRYSERPGDGPSMRAQEAELNKLMLANEDARIKQEAKDKETQMALEADVHRYGGHIRLGNGGKIEIDPAHRGLFTKAAKARGMGVQEFASKILENSDKYSSTMVKRANFARNASKWRANGGPLNDGVDPTTDPNAPVEVYPGHPQYGDYVAWKTANETYNKYNTFGSSFGSEPRILTEEQYRKEFALPDYKLPAGATGIAIYKSGSADKVGDVAGGNLPGVTAHAPASGSGNMYTAVPQYKKPEGNYTEVKDPKVVEQERINAEYAEKYKDIQGWKRVEYSEQVDTDNGVEWVKREELIPIPNGQYKPTDGTFVPKGNVPPPEYENIYTTPQKAYGGNIKYPNGGSLQPIPEANYDDFQLDYNDPFFNPYGATTGEDGITRAYQSKEAYREAYLKNQPYGLLKMPTISKINNIPNIETNFNDFTNKNLSSITPNTGNGQKGSAKTASPKNKQPLKIGNEEMSLLMSNLPAIDNILSSFNPERTTLERFKPEEVSFEKARQLAERKAAIGRVLARENVRGNARSSGEALSNLAASNSAITESVIQSHLQSLMAEESTNAQLRNEANQINNQIANQEIIANEQNQAMAKSAFNLGLADIGTNTQAYLKDKKMNAENIRQNKRLMSIINAFAPNYKWEDDNGAFAIQFITAAQNNQLPQ